MDFGKQGVSDNSSDEYEVKDDAEDPTKRPYECTFCKRGFTNAQALGGHMNIHRKDRAKAKQRIKYGSSQYSNEQSETGCKYFPPVSSQPAAAYYPTEGAHRNGYRSYFEPSAAATSYGFHQQRRTQSLSMNEELLGMNLSLQTDQTGGVWKNEEVDLELRLGHEYR